MKYLLPILLILLGSCKAQKSELSDVIDHTTNSKYTSLKTMALESHWDSNKNSFKTKNLMTLHTYLDEDFDHDDRCFMRQYKIVLEELIREPAYLNALDLDQIDLHAKFAPASVLSSLKLNVIRYSDPVLRVEFGILSKIYDNYKPFWKQRFCKIQSNEEIRYALFQLYKSQIKSNSNIKVKAPVAKKWTSVEAKGPIDKTTFDKYEHMLVDVDGKSFYSESKKFDNWYVQYFNTEMKGIFTASDYCLIQQYNLVIETLLGSPEYLNRLGIEKLRLRMFYGPQAVVAAKELNIILRRRYNKLRGRELINLEVELGNYRDVRFDQRKNFCKLQSKESLKKDLDTLLKNHIKSEPQPVKTP